ncbi:MAG: UDP-glucose 4-epimerase GalE [Proteobacteria bacterium]|nr:UDP-glucose 4-epimerase GalE [Pseudomonadota bacterium]
MSKNILVTGGAGYVGSHTCKALAAAGYTPVVYDSLVQGFDWAVRWGPFEHGDVRDGARLREVFAKYQPAALFHFAGFIAVGESVEKPDIYYDNNINGLLTALKAAREFGVGQVVFSSSAAIYGNPDEALIREDHPKNILNPYAATKHLSEQILADYDRAFGLRSVSLRYFNAAGADAEGETGEAHNPETHLIPLAFRAIYDPGFTLSIFGNDYDTPDGTAVRDYVHVTDLADAHLRALKYLEAGGATTALNLGSGRGYSIREILEAIEKVTGKPVPAIDAARRAGDPAVLAADIKKAEKVLGWKPVYSDLETIIKTAGAWEKGRWAGKFPKPLRSK